MKYNEPYGDLPDSPYINGDPSIGRRGSIPPAAAIEFPQRELVQFFTDSGLVPTNDDLRQLSKAVQNGQVIYGIDTGTANAMIAVIAPPITALIPGLTLRIKKSGAKNTGPATIDVGTGVNLIKRASGADLADNDLPAGIVTELIWDGSHWQMANFQGTGVAETNITYTTNIPYTTDIGSVNQIIGSFTPGIVALSAGLVVLVKVAYTTTGATQFRCTPDNVWKTVSRPDGSALKAGDIPAGGVALMVYDGTKWQLVAVNYPTPAAGVVVPFLETVGFSGSSRIYSPYYTKMSVPFSAWSGNTQNNVTISSGACYILQTGRYVLTWNHIASGANGNEPFTGLTCAMLFKNGGWLLGAAGWQSTGGTTYIKED